MGKDQKCITESLRFKNVCCDLDVIRTAMHTFLEFHGPINDEPLNE